MSRMGVPFTRSAPRPHYQKDPERVYGFSFAGFEVRFTVDGDQLTVRDIRPAE